MILTSVEMCRLLVRVYRALSDSDMQAAADLKKVIERLERTASDRGCPTCGSTYYTYEERSEP